MIELCFDTSACARLKMLRMEGRLPLGHPIVYCPDDLSLGAITLLTPEERRKSLKSYGVTVPPDFVETYSRFLHTVQTGTKFRLWFSKSSYELAGVAFICSLLYPRIQTVQACIANPEDFQIACIAELSPEGWVQLAQREAAIALQPYAKQWQKLVSENAPLRISSNGILKSENIDYFDESLSKQSAAEDCCTRATDALQQFITTHNGTFSIEFLIARAAALSS